MRHKEKSERARESQWGWMALGGRGRGIEETTASEDAIEGEWRLGEGRRRGKALSYRREGERAAVQRASESQRATARGEKDLWREQAR
jgi:hypothetical protein